MLYRQLSPIALNRKEINSINFNQRKFPVKITSEIKEWGGVKENSDFIRRIGFYDNFDNPPLTNRYNLTQLNGYITLDNGLLLSSPSAPGATGYTRIASKQNFTINREHTVKSMLFLYYWNQYSDIAIGLSTENEIGNTAYRGDLGLWIDYSTVKLFYRQTRTSPINTIDIVSAPFSNNDEVVLELSHKDNITKYSVIRNGYKIAEGQRTTFYYTNMYGILGMRDDAASEDITYVGADYFAVYSDPVETQVVSNDIHMPNGFILTTRELLNKLIYEQIGSKELHYKQIGTITLNKKYV